MKFLFTKKLFSKILFGSFFVLAFLFFFVPAANAGVLLPGNISSCGELATGGSGNSYTLTTDVSTSTGPCFVITASGVVINSVSTTTINGNISNIGFHVTFAGKVVNNGTVSGDALFTENSSNTGTVNGNVEVISPSPAPIGGTIHGNLAYHGYNFFPSSGLWGYWDLNESTNGTTPDGLDFLDRGPSYFNNGIAQGGLTTVNGKIGRAGYFDGVGQYIQMAKDFFPASNPPSEITISAWVKPDDVRDSMVVHNFTTGELDLSLGADAKFHWGQKFNCNTGDWYNIISQTTYSPGNWYYLTAITDLANHVMKLYVNGVLDNSISTSDCTSPYRPWNLISHIGAGADGGIPFKGLIDEVGIWSRPLSGLEISTLYNQGDGVGMVNDVNGELYFNSSTDGDWSNLSNWWQDSNYTIPALTLPISKDLVSVSSGIYAISGTSGSTTVSKIIFNDSDLGDGLVLNSNATLSGNSTNFGTINGTVDFSGSSVNKGVINGDTSFGNTTINSGTINGDVNFSGNSANAGTITGNVKVYYPSVKPVGGTVSGTVTYYGYHRVLYFNDKAAHAGNDGDWLNIKNWWNDPTFTVQAVELPTSIDDVVIMQNFNSLQDCVSLKSATFKGTTEFNSCFNVSDYAIFDDSSQNSGTINGNAIFNASGANTNGFVSGNADVYYPAPKPLGGAVVGVITYHGYPGFYFNDDISICDASSVCGAGDGDWGNADNWWTNDSFNEHTGSIPNVTDSVYIYGNLTQDTSGTAEVQSAIFENGSQNNINVGTNFGATFTGSSTNNGSVTGATVFKGDLTNNNGTVNKSFKGFHQSIGTNNYWDSFASNAKGDIILAGDDNYGFIYKSTDYGASWSQVPGTGNQYWYSMASNSTGDNIIAYNSSTNSLWRSTDYGNTWTQISSTTGNWGSITSNSTGSNLTASENNSGTLWRSLDYGASWIAVSGPGGGHSWTSIASNSTGSSTFAVDGSGSIWRSTNFGASWSAVSGTQLANGHWWNSITSNSTGSNLVAVDSAGSIWRSTNFGSSFVPVSGTSGHQWNSATSNSLGDILYVSTDEENGSVWKSSNYGANWAVVPNTESSSGYTGAILTNSTGDRFVTVDNNSGSILTYNASVKDDNSASLIRQYTESTSTKRDFTSEGGRDNWVIEAYNATINLTQAIYSRVSNIFKAFANSIFIPNHTIDNGVAVVPQVQVTSPVSGTISKWNPQVDWGNSSICEYKLDGGDYQALDCRKSGSDIPKPSALVQHTLSIEGVDNLGNLSEKIISFTYDNTIPTYTSCGSDLMDETSRPYYYLASDVVGDCTATVDVKLYGSQATTSKSGGFTLNGNLNSQGHNITLSNIVINGTVNASGMVSRANGGGVSIAYSRVSGLISNGYTGGVGGNGGVINVATSTTGNIYANGAVGYTKGGNGGTITVWNSDGLLAGTTVTTNGGDSSNNCSSAGDGGVINITNSDNYVALSNAGGSVCNSVHTGGHTSTPPVVSPRPALSPSSSSNSTPNHAGGSSDISRIITNPIIKYTDNLLHGVSLDFTQPNKLTLPDVKTLGEGKNTFTFNTLIAPFVLSPLPDSLNKSFDKYPKLKNLLSIFGISREQNLAALIKNPLIIKDDTLDTEGLFTVTNASSTKLRAYLSGDAKYKLVELVRTKTNTILFINTKSKIGVTGKSSDKTIVFTKKNETEFTAKITTPNKPGTYYLTTNSSPLTLVFEVTDPLPPPKPPVGWNLWNWVGSIFN